MVEVTATEWIEANRDRQELRAMAMRQAEELGSIKGAVRSLFETGCDGGKPLPVECRTTGPWQSQGTVAVRVDVLRALSRAAGVSDA